MSEQVQTESKEEALATPKLEEAASNGTDKVELENSVEKEEEESKEQLSDEQILDNLQKRVIPEGNETKESRKTRAIKRSIKDFDEAIVNDDEIDFKVLAEKFRKNSKGLESFAKAHNYDYEELLNEVNVEIEGVNNPYKQRAEEAEAQLYAKQAKEVEKEFRDTVVSLVASRGDITLSDFNDKHGEDFSLLVDGYIARGETLVDAAKKAFEKIKPDTTSEKDQLLNNTQAMPLGKDVEQKVEIELDTATNVNNPELYTTEQRRAYKKKYRRADNVVEYK